MPNSGPMQLAVPVTARDHAIGLADAPVTLLEYGDYECPHCGRAHAVFEELLKTYGDRVRFVYRHFPLVKFHPHAKLAAEAAEAAGGAGSEERFWAMHHLLFTHQSQLAPTDLVQYARELGLDIPQFEQDLTTHKYGPRVLEDLAGGMRSGVNGTPSVFINNRRYTGSKDQEGITAAIEEALRG